MTARRESDRHAAQREAFERACAEMAARGYSWRLIAERTGATPDECRLAASRHEWRMGRDLGARRGRP